MAESKRLICASSDLKNSGDGVRFDLPSIGVRVTGFVTRYNDEIHGYINRCAHVPVELDWEPGKFFDLTGSYLLCSTHGAHYEPMNGFCVMGPCKGKQLHRLPMIEFDGHIYLIEESKS